MVFISRISTFSFPSPHYCCPIFHFILFLLVCLKQFDYYFTELLLSLQTLGNFFTISNVCSLLLYLLFLFKIGHFPVCFEFFFIVSFSSGRCVCVCVYVFIGVPRALVGGDFSSERFYICFYVVL